ncbi:hypothetical protein HPP92_000195 [Vanilla planifolia]|uniref:Uncharacterized protein n=1 Tax=Vanilla planifolia TaxID=51239 RepID=A0A835VCD2_VANPL|nr:hypothetical protein HPP92_000195 [Vanilla planifolia]
MQLRVNDDDHIDGVDDTWDIPQDGYVPFRQWGREKVVKAEDKARLLSAYSFNFVEIELEIVAALFILTAFEVAGVQLHEATVVILQYTRPSTLHRWNGIAWVDFAGSISGGNSLEGEIKWYSADCVCMWVVWKTCNYLRMAKMNSDALETEESLSILLPSAPQNISSEIAEPDLEKRDVMARAGFGCQGQHIQLLSNHFSASIKSEEQLFHQYTITITYDDGHAVKGKGIYRKVMDKLFLTCSSELGGKPFVYDGDNCFFTLGKLSRQNFDLIVTLEESARVPCGSPGGESPCSGIQKLSRRSFLAKAFNIQIRYATEIPFRVIELAVKGSETEQTKDAVKVLNAILRQRHAKKGFLLVRQSYFGCDPANFTELDGGLIGCRGFHSIFCTTQSGLYLNMDVSNTLMVKPGPVIDFLISNQNVRNAKEVDWAKAKRVLRSLRIKARHNNLEFKIRGLSSLPCNQQTFQLRVKSGEGKDIPQEVTVFDYFKEKHIELTWSASLPCLDVGKPNRPCYLPIELCTLIPLQRYTKALSTQQRAALVEKSRQKPLERIKSVTSALQENQYDNDPLLCSFGITIKKQLTEIDGRVLSTPTLKFGNQEECVPKNGRWNFKDKKLLQAIPIECWAILSSSARCDLSHLSREMINCGRSKGIIINRPFTIIEESHQCARMGPSERVETMFEEVIKRLPGPPQLLLCVLPERKYSAIYGPWKKKNLHEMGVVTQCISPTRITEQYLTNVLLKINTKLGGINSLLVVEANPSIPLVTKVPTMIIGMNVSHASPGCSDLPSIAAVVGSRNWPLISRYSAAVRTQSAKVEMLDSLYKPLTNGLDDGMMRDLLLDFYESAGGRKPAQIVIFRDGISESQFNQVLNIELDQVIKAFQHLGEGPLPKFCLIIAQKNHHTKLFQASSHENVPSGTVVDTKIVHPRNYDFYMCSQAGMIGTTRPVRYQVLLDEIGFSPDNLQNLVHSLSYVYQRGTSAVSVVAPISYAHLAARQISQFIKLEEDFSESPEARAWDAAVPEMPRLHEDVRQSMFFC